MWIQDGGKTKLEEEKTLKKKGYLSGESREIKVAASRNETERGMMRRRARREHFREHRANFH